jgi:heme/copper-type cytochrome/quinol oxidase subunit 3
MAQITTTAQAPIEVPAERLLDVRKLGVWLFLVSEVLFFTALIGGSLLIRLWSPNGWPAPGEVLNIPLTSLNTFILICSSVTVVKALDRIQKGDQAGMKKYLLLTLAGGVFFLGVQAYEYVKLIEHGLFLTSYVDHHGETFMSPYGMTFYIQTGFHGAHVFIGVMWLLVVILKAFNGLYSKHNWVGVEAFGLYWHFVDLVWILLFTIVYLI